MALAEGKGKLFEKPLDDILLGSTTYLPDAPADPPGSCSPNDSLTNKYISSFIGIQACPESSALLDVKSVSHNVPVESDKEFEPPSLSSVSSAIASTHVPDNNEYLEEDDGTVDDTNDAAIVSAAWQLLQNPVSTIQSNELRSLLNRLGVTEAEDLLYCEEEGLNSIEELLESVPKEKMRQLRAEWKLQYIAKRFRVEAFVQGERERASNCTIQ